jgi:hypothetical protein
MVGSLGNVFGSVSDGEESYTISTTYDALSNASKFEFNAITLNDLPEEHDGREPEEDERRRLVSVPSLRGGLVANTGDIVVANNSTTPRDLEGVTSVVDVLVIYTGATKRSAGGGGAILNQIGLAMYQTNTALANAGSDVRVRLVKTKEDTRYPDTSSKSLWKALKYPGDGYFDYVETLRNDVGADIVMLLANYVSEYCGVAVYGGHLGAAKRTCATRSGQYTFAHAVGYQFVSLPSCVASSTLSCCSFIVCFYRRPYMTFDSVVGTETIVGSSTTFFVTEPS